MYLVRKDFVNCLIDLKCDDWSTKILIQLKEQINGRLLMYVFYNMYITIFARTAINIVGSC